MVYIFCRECPYVKEEFETKMDYLLLKENDLYSVNEIEQSCWCEKTGGKVWWYGQCSDGKLQFNEDWDNRKRIKKSKKRVRKNKVERNESYKIKLKHKAKLRQGVYLVDAKYIRGHGYVPIEKPYYKEFYRGNKYYKNYSNRCVRRHKGDIANGNSYRKVFDYWWTID